MELFYERLMKVGRSSCERNTYFISLRSRENDGNDVNAHLAIVGASKSITAILVFLVPLK